MQMLPWTGNNINYACSAVIINGEWSHKRLWCIHWQ